MALMYTRLLDLPELLGHRSVFLFGPRQTGKSTLVRATLPDAASYDLLEADTFRELSARPESLRQTLDPRKRVLVVDEIQKLPCCSTRYSSCSTATATCASFSPAAAPESSSGAPPTCSAGGRG